MKRRFRIEISCAGVAPSAGETAAREIAMEFRLHRDWHDEADCKYDGGLLTLIVVNDFDDNGTATLDEFGDCLAAYLDTNGEVRILRVEQI